MMRGRGSLIAGVAMLLALGAASATDAATGPAAPVTTSASEQTVTSGVGESDVHGDITSGRILFVTERHGPEVHDLRVLAPDGLTTVETADGTFANAVWAGGDAIVFDSERAGPRHIFRQEDYRGGDPIQLLAGTDDGDERAGVSSDGSAIVVDRYDNSTNRDLGIWIVPSAGGAGTQVTPAGEEGTTSGATYTSFSPDDSEVVYARIVDWEDPIVGGVFVVDASGGAPRRITPDVVGLGMPRFSPDGTQILFSQYVADDQSTSLWVVPTSGETPTKLFDVPANAAAFEADWSPDGRQLVFKWFEQGWDHNELRVADVDGSNMRTVWTGQSGETAETPDWGP